MQIIADLLHSLNILENAAKNPPTFTLHNFQEILDYHVNSFNREKIGLLLQKNKETETAQLLIAAITDKLSIVCNDASAQLEKIPESSRSSEFSAFLLMNGALLAILSYSLKLGSDDIRVLETLSALEERKHILLSISDLRVRTQQQRSGAAADSSGEFPEDIRERWALIKSILPLEREYHGPAEEFLEMIKGNDQLSSSYHHGIIDLTLTDEILEIFRDLSENLHQKQAEIEQALKDLEELDTGDADRTEYNETTKPLKKQLTHINQMIHFTNTLLSLRGLAIPPNIDEINTILQNEELANDVANLLGDVYQESHGRELELFASGIEVLRDIITSLRPELRQEAADEEGIDGTIPAARF